MRTLAFDLGNPRCGVWGLRILRRLETAMTMDDRARAHFCWLLFGSVCSV